MSEEQTSANKISTSPIPEVVEYSVAMILEHFSMNIEARIAKFGDLLGEKLNSIHRIAENNWLVNLELFGKMINHIYQFPETEIIDVSIYTRYT